MKTRSLRLISRAFAIIEQLEQRLVLTGGTTFSAAIDQFRMLEIFGTDSADQITAEVRDDTGDLVVTGRTATAGGPGTPVEFIFKLADFDRIMLDAAGGDDFVNFIDPAQTLDRKTLNLDAGDGDNIVALTHQQFDPAIAQHIRDLLNLSDELASLATRAGDATVTSIQVDAMNLINEGRISLVDVSQALAADVGAKLFDSVQALVDRSQTELFGLGQSIVDQVNALADRDALFVATASLKFDPTNGVFPDDDNDEQSGAVDIEPEVDPMVEEPVSSDLEQMQAEQLTADALALSNTAQSQLAEAGAGFAADATRIEEQGAAFEQSANQLAVAGDNFSAHSEEVMATSTGRIQAIVEELNNFSQRFTEIGNALLGETMRSLSMADHTMAPHTVSAMAEGEDCVIVAVHTFTGGSGNDFFLPISAPNQSWLIYGGSGTNILFGGLADDEFQGGADSDLVFGLKGNDLIHGNGGTDLLVGEFLFDIPGMTGNDCIYGDDGTDILIGDSLMELALFGTAIRGDDKLHGGADEDILIGDDATDLANPTAIGGMDTMNGDEGDDAMCGTGGVDTMYGDNGIDFILGNGGDDMIYGGTGRDINVNGVTIHAGNVLLGNLDNDEIHGGDKLDVIFGNDGDDKLYGADEIDLMFGGGGQDQMYGEAGGQIATINGVPIRLGNFMVGGDENDKMWGGGDLDSLWGNDGEDEMHGYNGTFQLFGIDADLMFGGDGDDLMEGDYETFENTNSTDWIFGGSGNDTLEGGSQSDFLFGGTGLDTISGDSNSLDPTPSNDFLSGGPDRDFLHGGNNTDLIFGDAGNDVLTGDDESLLPPSHDFLAGGLGQDSINGGAGIDFILGGAGDDTLRGDTDNLLLPLSMDLVIGGSGNDTMNGGNGMDFVFGGDGADSIWGDGSVFGEFSQDFLFGEQGNDNIDGGTHTDLVVGGLGDDTLTGDIGLNWMILSIDMIVGNDGCDTLLGGRATDFMFGDAGIDRIDGQWGADVILGGGSSDTIYGGDLFDILTGGDGNDEIHGGDGLDFIFGGDGADCLNGDNGPDVVFGDADDDCLQGGNGPDILRGNDGNDLIFGDNGADSISGGAGDDRLDGGNGPDWINGNSGDDTLWGCAGVDILIGGLGSDTKHQTDCSGLMCDCQIDICPQYDFGDAPDSYGTLMGNNGAQSVVNGPRLGGLIDAESTGIPSAGANGDDNTGLGDEDGVTLTDVMVGGLGTALVSLTNADSAKLDAWIDFNINGVFDSNEQILNSVTIYAGTHAVNFAIPVNATVGATYARFRVSTTGGLGPTGLGGLGEVEDYQATVLPPRFDFGDAPQSYSTLLLDDGARHLINGPRLGSRIDGESDGVPTAGATGDVAGIDDEDGVILSSLTTGSVGTATVTLSGAATARLDAWIDFNHDGDFSDPSEQIFNSVTIGLTNSLTFTVPSNAAATTTMARFRVSKVGGLGPNGFGGAGEVEDYQVAIQKKLLVEAPDIFLTLAETSYVHGQKPVFAIDAGARFNPGSPVPTFAGSKLVVSITSIHRNSSDILSILPGSASDIHLKGTKLLFGNSVIGNISGGRRKTPDLTITFTSAANATLVEKTIQRLSFSAKNVGSGPRTIQIRLTNTGTQNSNTATRQINIR